MRISYSIGGRVVMIIGVFGIYIFVKALTTTVFHDTASGIDDKIATENAFIITPTTTKSEVFEPELTIDKPEINTSDITQSISEESPDSIDSPVVEENISEPIAISLPSKNNHKVMTTVFWVGESADASNAYITNIMSAWDIHWLEHFGGIDDPDNRCGYYPCDFTPMENPFYFALPYSDATRRGRLKDSAKLIPWYAGEEWPTILKNRWIAITYNNTTCYAQWQDVGPLETDDYEYVFGDAEHKNTFGVNAGLDISPATRTCLGFSGNAITTWKFVDATEVPDGPWTEIITTSGISR